MILLGETLNHKLFLGLSPVQFWFQTWQQSPPKMTFKILFVFTICLIGLSLAVPMPWVQGGGKFSLRSLMKSG